MAEQHKKTGEVSSGVATLLAAAGLAAYIYAHVHHQADHPHSLHLTQRGSMAVAGVRPNRQRSNQPITYHETTTGQQVPSRVDNFIYYSQTDKRWSYAPYNTGVTKSFNIGWNGCEPTTAAMVVSTLTGKHVSPVDAAAFNVKHGYIIPDVVHGKPGGGTDGKPAIQAFAESYGLEAHAIPLQLANVENVLSKGGYVVFNGQDTNNLTPATSSGHVMAIRGITPDKHLLIANPDSIADTMSAWDAHYLLGPASYAVAVLPSTSGDH